MGRRWWMLLVLSVCLSTTVVALEVQEKPWIDGHPLVVVSPLGKGEVVLFCAPMGIVTLGWGGFGAGFDEFLRRCLDEPFDHAEKGS